MSLAEPLARPTTIPLRAESARSRVPTLDGLRALSLLLVMLSHQFLREPRMFAVGQMGVRIFFVISGYIITLLLLREKQETGHVSLMHFYAKRSLRIFPPFYAYVAAVYLLSRLGWISPVPLADLWSALTYTSNYAADMNPKLAHLWSLSVEEQFYLLWPFAFAFLTLQGAKRLLWFVVVIVPLVRLATIQGLLPSLNLGWTFHTVADALAWGCLAALISESSPLRLMLERCPNSLSGLFLVGLPALAIVWEWSAPNSSPFLAPTIASIGIACFIARQARPSGGGLAFRILNWGPLVQLGYWSYSIYLWQQLFLLPTTKQRIWTTFPVNYLAVMVLALGSYYLIEKPTLRFRKRLEALRTSA